MDKNYLNKEDPDYELEIFWFTYKCCFNNFYQKYSYFDTDTDIWCKELNLLKNEKNYDLIQKKIADYLLFQSCDVIKSMDYYHLQILKTNINRYIKLCEKVKFYIFTTELSIIDNIIRIYLCILKGILKRNDYYIFDNIYSILLDNNYDSLIKYAFKNKKGVILDRLRNIKDIREDIYRIFNLNLESVTSGKKILNLYYNREK